MRGLAPIVRVARAVPLVFVVLGVALGAPPAAAQVTPAPVASAELYDRGGRPLAIATLREASDQVVINLAFMDRSALTGIHAIQIHEFGRCEPPDFASAGAIFNPYAKQHGLLNPDGPMAGDLPSMVLGPGGASAYNLSAPLVSINSGPAALLRPGGTSLVIFERVDDDLSQPEGNTGARVACGVIVGGTDPLVSPASTVPNSDRDRTTNLLVVGLGVLLIGAGLGLRRRSTPHPSG